MSTGKFSNDDFEKIVLNQCGATRPEIHQGPAFGVDVSVIKLGGNLAMAMTSDPLSLVPNLGLQESAWLSIHLMANDMATTGIPPAYVQMVLNLPETLSKDDFNTYWSFVNHYCKEIGVTITGGHTGAIGEQTSTIIGGGTMVLTAPVDQILLSCYAQPGDLIIMTKECALSSSSILAMSFPKTVIKSLGKETYQNACNLFHQTSSLKDGLVAAECHKNIQQITAMHDVTEGGVLGAIYEMAIASGNGVEINNQALPISHAVSEICNLFDIDPRYSIGAGSMIIAVKENYAKQLIEKLKRSNINAALIGKFIEKEKGYILLDDSEIKPLNYYPEDRYWQAFFNAVKRGWK